MLFHIAYQNSFLSYFGFGGKKEKEESEEDEGDYEDDIDEGVHKNFVVRNKLPDGFADEVLDLELKLEKDCTQADVDRLIYLYSQAMEFYEPVNKDKYLSFKNRIQKLLINPSMFNRMKNDPTGGRERCLTDINGKRPNIIKIDKEAPKCSQGPSKLTSTLAQKKVNQTKNLHMNIKISESANNMIQDDISAQKANLHKRLVQRKFKGINNKMNPDVSSLFLDHFIV